MLPMIDDGFDDDKKKGDFIKSAKKKKEIKAKMLIICMAISFLVGGVCSVLFIPAKSIIGFRKDLSESIDPGYITDVGALAGDFRSICNLTTVDYKYRGVGDTGSTAATLLGIEVPFTDQRLLVTYDGEIFAGVDMNDLSDSDVTKDGTVITVRLPKAKVLSNAIVSGSETTVEDKATAFNQLSEDQRDQFRAQWVNDMEQVAISNGLLDRAEQNAKDAIEEYAKDILPNGYTVNVVLPEDSSTTTN